MRALVLRGGRARIEQRPMPVAAANDVIVRTTAASLCSADVACLSGDSAGPDGTVLGHEAVGLVHETGSAVTGFTVGQRVAVASGTSCGQCVNCQRGYSGHCGGVMWGAYSSGVTRDGSMAEFFTVPHARHNLAVIPDAVGDAAAVCATDTLGSGSAGPEAARFPLGSVVAVFGQGHIGLGAVAGARLLGAARVITVKATPGGEDVSAAMGADVCLNLAEHDVIGEIKMLTDGQGVDCAVEATGVADSFPRAVEATRLGGAVAVLSSYSGPPDAVLPIPLVHWGWGVGDKTILSTFAPAGSVRLARLLSLIETGRIDPGPLVTHRYSFEEAPSALNDLAERRRGLIKPLITF
jgi:threonine dehydrogenase-like Zn-dependent dehydrogenase